MKLQYKISISIFLISLAMLVSVSYFYSQWSYKTIIKSEKNKLADNAIESAKYIELKLLNKLSNTLTISSAPIVMKSLEKSNSEYENLNDEQKTKKIDELNKKWMDAKNAEDSFIKPYLNNDLSLFLKKQQSILKDVYGELFITNKYGAMIATTAKLTTLAHAKKYWWKKAYASGHGAVFFDDRGFDTSVEGYVIGVTVPVKQGDKVIGILKANVNIMNALNTVVSHYNDKHHGILKVARTKGLVVYERDVLPLSTNINPLILKNLKNRESGVRMVKNHIPDCLIAYAPLRLSLDNKNIGFGGKSKTIDHSQGNDSEIWHAVISYPKDIALAGSMQTNKMIIYIGLFVSFLSAVVAFFTGKWISRPVEELQIAQVKLQEQEEIMIAQSRHAAMGEMIGMIAHQWRQPISVISMEASNIIVDIELESLNEDDLKECADGIIQQTQELSKTIDDFRNFFRPEKSMDDVAVEDIIDDAIKVIGKSLQNNNINVILELSQYEKIKTYSRELMQVIISIINNAKEVLVEKDIAEKKISISLKENKESLVLNICDNGGGIDSEIVNKIFEPYFTTKNEKNGTGLGLYMSQIIIEKHLKGTLDVINIDDGACFRIKIPIKS